MVSGPTETYNRRHISRQCAGSAGNRLRFRGSLMDAVIAAVLALHLYFVSVSAAGPLGVLWCDWWGRPDDEAVQRGARWMAMLSLLALVVGAVLGLIIGFLVWDDAFRQALGRLHAKLAWGTMEWLFSFVLTGIVAWWWRRRPDATGWARRMRGFLSLLTATNLLYHFSFLFFVMQRVAQEGGDGPIDPATFRGYMADGLILAKAIHFLLATFILTGITWMAAGASWLKTDPGDQAARRVATWGGRMALPPAVLQLVVGLWLITKMPTLQQKVIMGGDMAASLLFVVAVLLALWMMHLLAMAALGKATAKKLRMAIVVTMVVLVCMLFVARKTRAVRVADIRSAPAMAVRLTAA